MFGILGQKNKIVRKRFFGESFDIVGKKFRTFEQALGIAEEENGIVGKEPDIVGKKLDIVERGVDIALGLIDTEVRYNDLQRKVDIVVLNNSVE